MAGPLPPKIGKYEVRGALGEGGFGRVYKAFDPQVGRLVAVKVLTAQSSPDMLARFQNEAQAAGSLHHENIVIVYEFGVHDGAPFIAMEYLDGMDLNQVITAKQSLSLLDKVRIMFQVGQGLQCAHENGVVHRDVKPANIKVLPNRMVKMMDFGIARLTNDDSTRLTHKGDLIGTIRYMSPEQFAGEDVDALCDIFAYGVIFYELVTGVHPFESPNVAAFMTRITSDAPENQPAPLTKLVPGCPPALSQIVMRSLEKDRDLRYQNLDDLLLDMRPLLNELKRERASELFSLAYDLFAAGEVQRAQSYMREIIDLDASNPEVWELRDRIQQAAHRRTVRPKIEAYLRTAEADLARRMFPEAIESLEAAARLDPNDADIAQRIADARQQWDAAIKSGRLLSDAGAEFERHNLTIAERYAAQALEIDPRNNRAAEMLQSVRDDLQRRDNERRLKQILDEARRLAAVEDFDAAIDRLQAPGDVADPQRLIPAELARVREQKTVRAREERLRSEKTILRGILKDSRFADAEQRLESLCREFPEDRDLASLLTDTRKRLREIQREEDIRRAKAEATTLGTAGRFAEAEEVLRRLASAYSGDPDILFLLKAAERAREDYERRQKLTRIVRGAEQLRADRRFEEAKQALEAGTRDFGDDTILTEERRRLDADWSEHRRLERLREALSSAREILAEGHYDSAMGVLKQAAAENPQNPEIEELMREARVLAERQRVNRAIDQACVQARELAASHDYDSAATTLRRGLKNHPDEPRLVGLLADVERQKKDWDREQALREAIRSNTQLLRDRRYPEAIHAIEVHLEKMPGEPALQKLLGQAKSEWEAYKKAEALDRATGEIRAAVGQGRLDEAEVLLDHYEAEFGTATSFVALRTQVRDSVQKSERERQIAEDRGQIQGLLEQGNASAALEVSKTAIARNPGAPDLMDLFSQIQQRVARERREADVSRLTGLIRHAIALGDWNAAAARIDELGRLYPDEPSVTGLKESLHGERRRVETEQALSALEDAIRRGEWVLAEKQYNAVAPLAPDSPRVAAARARLDRRKQRDKALAEARTAQRKQRLEDVERLLAPIVAEDPGDTDATTLLQQVQAQRTAADADAAIRQGRRQAKALSKEQKFEEAIAILQDLLDRYGPQPDLVRDRDQIAAGADRQRSVLRLEEQLRAGNARQVLDETTKLLALSDSPEFRDLQARAQRALVETQEPEPPQPKPVDELVARLGWLAGVGDLDGAAQALAEGLKTFPNEPQLLEWKRNLAVEKQRRDGLTQARSLIAQWKYDEAAVVLNNVLAANPNDPDAVAMLKTVQASRSKPRAPKPVPELPPEPAPKAASWKMPAVIGGAAAAVVVVGVLVKTFVFPAPAPPLTISPAIPAEGRVNEAFSGSLTASGGVPPYQWSAKGPLPAGLRLGPATGAISGVPTAAGQFAVEIDATDSKGHSATSPVSVLIRSAPVKRPTPEPPPKPEPLQLVASAPRQGTVNQPYSFHLEATGGTPPYKWTVNRVPTGLELNADGSISGTPLRAGSTDVRAGVTDATGHSAEDTFRFAIEPAAVVTPPLNITTSSLPSGKVRMIYDGTLSASGGSGGYKWSLASGRLPDGLSLDGSSGLIKGTPGAEGRANFQVRVTDGQGNRKESAFTIAIAAADAVKENKGGGQPPPTLMCPAATPITREDADLQSGAKYAIEWTGSAGSVPVVIRGKQPNQGNVRSGRALSGAPVDVTVSSNAKVLEPPTAQNGFRCIAFQPTGSPVRIEWTVR